MVLISFNLGIYHICECNSVILPVRMTIYPTSGTGITTPNPPAPPPLGRLNFYINHNPLLSLSLNKPSFGINLLAHCIHPITLQKKTVNKLGHKIRQREWVRNKGRRREEELVWIILFQHLFTSSFFSLPLFPITYQRNRREKTKEQLSCLLALWDGLT